MYSKTIIFVRHAKSSWEDINLPDKERSLNDRGRREAPIMAEWLSNTKYIPQVIISSTAKRTLQTARSFQKRLSIGTDSFRGYDSLYHAAEETYWTTCYELEESIDAVMFIGHNPGLTYLVNSISTEIIDNVPTCGIAIVKCNVYSWNEVDAQHSELIQFVTPKMLR